MEKEKKEVVTEPRNGIVMIIVAVIITALVVGFGVYFWQQSRMDSIKQDLQKQTQQVQAGFQKDANSTSQEKEDHLTNEEKREADREKIRKIYEDKEDPFRVDSEFSSEYRGKVIVTGYPVVKKGLHSFCDPETEDCEISLVDFNVLESNNDVFSERYKNISVGLGCLEGKEIRYFFGKDPFEIDEKMTKAIMSATKDNPIVIELEAMPHFEWAFGGSECNISFTHIRLTSQRYIEKDGEKFLKIHK